MKTALVTVLEKLQQTCKKLGSTSVLTVTESRVYSRCYKISIDGNETTAGRAMLWESNKKVGDR
jgi:hypothetical protein